MLFPTPFGRKNRISLNYPQVIKVQAHQILALTLPTIRSAVRAAIFGG